MSYESKRWCFNHDIRNLQRTEAVIERELSDIKMVNRKKRKCPNADIRLRGNNRSVGQSKGRLLV